MEVYSDNNSMGDFLWYQSCVSSTSNQSCMESMDRENSLISFVSDQSKNTFGEQGELGLPYIDNRSSAYFQLMDDLSIIEDYKICDDGIDDEGYELDIAETARNVEHKKYCVNTLAQTEEAYINDMQTFRNIYISPINNWIGSADTVENENLEETVAPLFKDFMQVLTDILQTHKVLLQEIRERQQIWGPTQFISDIFAVFFDQLDFYDNLLSSYPHIIITLYRLFSRSSSFRTLIEGSENFDSSSHKFLYYFALPMQHLPSYRDIIRDICSVTDISHPDYHCLEQIKNKFALRNKEWSTLLVDRLAHIQALGSARYVQGNPVNVSMVRRLHIADRLIRVDPAHPRSVLDTRLYLLYSDNLIYCQKYNPTTEGDKDVKSQFKGSIQLLKAEVKRISPEIVAKIGKAKKPSPLNSLIHRRKSEVKSRQNSLSQDIFGFELNTYEISLDSQDSSNGRISLPRTIRSNIILRTKTEEEQNMWLYYLNEIIRQLAAGGKKFS